MATLDIEKIESVPSPVSDPGEKSSLDEDALKLAAMGYSQDMKRKFSLLSLLGVGFSLTNSWFGMSASLITGISSGGPLLVMYGIPWIAFISSCVAITLSELTSSMPNAGGQYFWANELASPKYANFASYLTGWFAWTGSIFTSASVALGLASAGIVIAGVINGHVASKYLYVRLFRGTNRMSQRSWTSVGTWVGMTIVLWVIAWIIAEAIPVFNNLLSLITALFASWFTFGLNGWFWLYLNKGRYFSSPRKIFLTFVNIFCVGAGALICGLGLYVSGRAINEQSGASSSFSCSKAAQAAKQLSNVQPKELNVNTRRATSRAASGEPSNTPIPGGFDHRFQTLPPNEPEPQSPPETARKDPSSMAEPIGISEAVLQDIEGAARYRALQIATLYKKLVQQGIPLEGADSMPPPNEPERQSPPETARKDPPSMAEPIDISEAVPQDIEDDAMYKALQITTLYKKLVQQGIPLEVAGSMAATEAKVYLTMPSLQQPPGDSNDRVKEFREQHGFVSLRIDIKLAGRANYQSWRREVEVKAALFQASHILLNYENGPPEDADIDDSLIWQYKEIKLWKVIWNSLEIDVKEKMQAKLRDGDSGTGFMRKVAVLWRLLEDHYQIHDADLQTRLIDKICKLSIDDYGGDIIIYARAWQNTVADLRYNGIQPPDFFLRQRFILSLGKYASSHVQRFLLKLREDKPKTYVPEFSVDDLISELIRQKIMFQPDAKK
ncbi:hypothetical protein ACJ72_02400 [Emergomyces africanus]|uniref:Amino acid transporter transmembrane domain-containing protein n=1 Tax=Emergomyces africanus TaxID=1955775 RepID=A0A1B7P2I4_9EURO|nr:hypothetical protein ACJ72_02400 [Emergomyces africanus]